MQPQITTIEEIERVNLRFMRVNDDGKLSQILDKILASLILVYVEPDLLNASMEDLKVKALEELMTQLTNRVENSRGGVITPTQQLVGILHNPDFLNFQNQLMRRVMTERIYVFITATLEFGVQNIQNPQEFIEQIMSCLKAPAVSSLEKIRLFVMALWHAIQTDPKCLEEAIKNSQNREVFLQYLLLFTISMIASPNQNWQSNFKPLFLGQISLYYKNDAKKSELQHLQLFEQLLLVKLLLKQECFQPQNIVPILLLATSDRQACSHGVRDTCLTYLQNIQVDLSDPKLERAIFMYLDKKYEVYSDCVATENMISDAPPVVLKYLISWVIKLETQTDALVKLKVVNMCLSQPLEDMHKQGLTLARSIIRTDPQLNDVGVTAIRDALVAVLNSTVQSYSEDSSAMSLLMLAELGHKNYNLVLGNNIRYALTTFEKLKSRIEEVHKFLSIREDDLCLTYMEALNKLRDCYEQNLGECPEKAILLDKMVYFLHSSEARDISNSELIYILYLYLAKLDKENLSAALLLHSINLKDHPDIKIRKEVALQLERFELTPKEKQKGLLASFLDSLRLLFVSEQNPCYDLVTNNDSEVRSSLTYNVNNSVFVTTMIMDKIFELSQYTLRFYKLDQTNQEEVEKLLLLNLNQNFTNLKSDFTKPLHLIKQYLKFTKKFETDVILTTDACSFIKNVGLNNSSLEQKILSLRLLDKIYSVKPACFQVNGSQNEENIKTHEARLVALYNLSLNAKFSSTASTSAFKQLADQISSNVTMTPNVLEEQKLLANCLAILPFEEAFQNSVEALLKNTLNRQLDTTNSASGYKQKVLQCLPAICQKNKPLSETILSQLNQLFDFDNPDVQTVIGKCLSKIWFDQELILSKLPELIAQSSNTAIELNQKRNVVIYIFQIVKRLASTISEIRSKHFIEIQNVFMRYLFDRRPVMQDLASEGLSLIYKLGDQQQRELLVNSLSNAFSGGNVQKKEQDENQEMLLDFNDSTSQEQREKLKTYKDLVRVADELGQRDLIYQFLEVHRSNQKQQDIKNAAKGMTGLLMLDDKIKESLIKIAPKILLLTYDHNQEVQDTMRQLWAALISADQETKVINQRWGEIYEECYKGIKGDAWRNRQAACLCLSDLVLGSNRTWQELSNHYREIFLTTLGLLQSDVKESVQSAAYKLIKSLRTFTLKFSNMYSNTDQKELQEVIDMLVPMVLDDCLKSQIQKVRVFGLHILAELIRSTQSQNVADKLKINNKWERQLVLSSNSPQKMSAMLNHKGYLQRIITEMILNVSMLGDKTTVTLNYAEQMAADGKLKIAESELSDLRMRYSRESLNGEILNICRIQLMTHETFDDSLNTLLQIIQKGSYDQLTKQTAVSFIIDTVLENISLIKPQSSKKIAQKIVQMYTQMTPTAAMAIKETLQQGYASCVGMQFKIIREFPNTVQQILDAIAELDPALVLVKCLFFHEIQKQLPSQFLENPLISAKFLPLIYVNKFNDQNEKLKKISTKAWEHQVEILRGEAEIGRLHSKVILAEIAISFDSQSYAERISAANAFKAMIQLANDEDLVNQVIEKLTEVIYGKYFQGKDQIVKVFSDMIKDSLVDEPLNYAKEILPQIKNVKLEHDYRTCLLKSLKHCSRSQQNQELTDFLTIWLAELSEKLSQLFEKNQANLLDDQNGQFNGMDGLKEFEKQLLTTVISIYELMPKLFAPGSLPLLCIKKFVKVE